MLGGGGGASTKRTCFIARDLFFLRKQPSRVLTSNTHRSSSLLPNTPLSHSQPFPWKRVSHITAYLSDSNAGYSSRPSQQAINTSLDGRLLYSTATSSGKDATGKSAFDQVASTKTASESVADMKILKTLASYLWMKDNFEFRFRVVAALGFLVGAKVLNVQVPFLFKLAVDWLTAATTTNAGALTDFAAANSTAVALFATPAAVLVGYGIARTTASAFNGIIYGVCCFCFVVWCLIVNSLFFGRIENCSVL